MGVMNVTKKKPAVFLDRDGVLVKEKGYVTSKDKMELFPYAAECVAQIHQKGYYAIVVTNQSGIARGLFTEESLQEMNDYLKIETGVDVVYYCPHHPKGIVKQYQCVCHCRKPETGMIDMACSRFDIDLSKSYMVGDRAGDIRTGQRAGVRTILLESGYGTLRLEEQVTPDFIRNDLRDVIEILG